MFDLFARKSAALITLKPQESFVYQGGKLFQYYVCLKGNCESMKRAITLKRTAENHGA